MTEGQYLDQLYALREECGLNTEDEAADYVLLHYNAFEPGFVAFCERFLGTPPEAA
jgi:hypothetical protein